MKYAVMFLLLISAAAQSATEKIAVTWFEDFPQMDIPPELSYFFFECTGGGVPVGPFECSEGGIHLRGLQGYTCLLDENMDVIATTWFELNANWDGEYTGPVYGEWKVFMVDPDDPEDPGCNMQVAFSPHDSYFVGTFSGKRRLGLSPEGIPTPMTWYGSWKLDGYGVGDFEGIQFKSVNDYVTYHTILFDYESIPLWYPGVMSDWPEGIEGMPEGTIYGKMIVEDDD